MITVRLIVKIVAQVCSVEEADLYGPKRYQSLCKPRHLVMWVARTITDMSFNEIGRVLNNRDHTTILSGELRMRGLIATDAKWRKRAEEVLSRISDERAKAARETLRNRGVGKDAA